MALFNCCIAAVELRVLIDRAAGVILLRERILCSTVGAFPSAP
ncbi:hypothetical protein [Streptomyces sp. SID5643]|nr:hypothetical protein [Streptomyces sp. SID5643]